MNSRKTISKENILVPKVLSCCLVCKMTHHFHLHGSNYRVSRQLVLNFDFNFWFIWFSYQKNLICNKNPNGFNLDFATLIITKLQKLNNFFTCWKKLPPNFFCAGPPPPPELHIRIFFSDSCTPVHRILIFLQIYVHRYMECRFFSLFLCVAQGVGVDRRKI